MNFKNEGLTVGELSIAIATLIVVFFIWSNLTKDNSDQKVSMISNNLHSISYKK